MNIDLGQERVFNVTYNGSSYKMREPTVREVNSFKKDHENSDEAVIDFLDKLGLPKEIILNLSISKIKYLVDTMVGVISEKK